MLSFEAPDDTPSPSVVHKAAVAWAKTLEQGGYVAFSRPLWCWADWGLT